MTIGSNEPTSFYNESEIRAIDINLGNVGFSSINADIETLATMTFEEQTYDSLGIRIKGTSSDFGNPSQKRSLNITVDYGINIQNV